MGVARLLRTFDISKCLPVAKMIHGKLLSSGSLTVYTGNRLIGMYVDCGDLEDASQVFFEMPDRNVVSWTRLIFGYTERGLPESALGYLRSMVEEGIEPNEYSYVAAVSACTALGTLEKGKEIHGRCFRCSYSTSVFVSNALINLYAKIGLLKFANQVFRSISQPSSVSWTSIIAGLAKRGETKEALSMFLESQLVGIKLSPHSSASALGACASMADLYCGLQIHAQVIKCGIERETFVENEIIDMYAKCGKLDSAYRAFAVSVDPSIVSWTTLIAGYAQQGKEQMGLILFGEMHASGPKPNEYTFSCVLGACGGMEALEQGKQLHCLSLKTSYKLSRFVGNALLDMYSKCRLLEDSIKVFEEMEDHDAISWNTLIAGHAQSDYGWKAFAIFDQMVLRSIKPTVFTYSCILSLCGDLPAPQWGRQIHGHIIKPGLSTDLFVGNSLVDMYANSGRIRDAVNAFNCLPIRNLVSWNTILMGYAQHGFGKEALEIFALMLESGMEPNDITFLGVLTACGRAGLVEDGFRYFESMYRDHGIAPRSDHHACVVDLLGRAGQLRRAYEFITRIPSQPDKVAWRCLLSACVSHKDVVLGKVAAEHITRIDPQDMSAYVMLSGIYSEHRMWDETAKVRRITKEKGLKKDPGCSWIELRNKVHAFLAGDRTHEECDVIYDLLNGLMAHISDAGYVPDMAYALNHLVF